MIPEEDRAPLGYLSEKRRVASDLNESTDHPIEVAAAVHEAKVIAKHDGKSHVKPPVEGPNKEIDRFPLHILHAPDKPFDTLLDERLVVRGAASHMDDERILGISLVERVSCSENGVHWGSLVQWFEDVVEMALRKRSSSVGIAGTGAHM